MNSNNPKKSNIDYKNKLRKRNLPELESPPKPAEINKKQSKQIVVKDKNRSKDEKLDVIYILDANLKNLIKQTTEDLVKKNLDQKEKKIKIKDCKSNLAKFHNIRENQIIYYDNKIVTINKTKQIYTGFLVKKIPEWYGKLTGGAETYEGHFVNGKKDDKNATLIIGREKYIGGFNMDKKSGYGETYRNHFLGYYLFEEEQWYKVSEGEYQNDKQHGHGSIFMYHEEIRTSVKFEEGNYSNGLKNGFFKRYSINRRGDSFLGETLNIKNNVLDGYIKFYNRKSGKLEMISHVNEFRDDEIFISYAEGGNLNRLCFGNYELGVCFQASSKILRRTKWFENLGTFIAATYFNNGNLKSIGLTNDRAGRFKCGYNICYDQDTGQKTKEGNFTHECLNGNGKLYDDEGQLKFEGNFTRGHKNGDGIEYHNNTKIASKGNYIYDSLHGHTQFFDEQGYLKEEGEFHNGKKHKHFKIYDQNGQVEDIKYFEGEICNFDPNNSVEDTCDCGMCKKIRDTKVQIEELTNRVAQAENDRNESNGNRLSIQDILEQRYQSEQPERHLRGNNNGILDVIGRNFPNGALDNNFEENFNGTFLARQMLARMIEDSDSEDFNGFHMHYYDSDDDSDDY